MIHYDSLLQNATYIITKCDKSLLQSESGFLLQNATVLLQNATVFYKMRRLFCKMQRLLQNVTFVTNSDSTNCKCFPCIEVSLLSLSKESYN